MMYKFSSLNLCAGFLVEYKHDNFYFINKPMLSLLAIEPKTILLLLNKVRNREQRKLNLYSRKLRLYVFLRRYNEDTFVIITPYPRLFIFLEPLRNYISVFLEKGFFHMSVEISMGTNYFLLANYVLNRMLHEKKLVSKILDEIYEDIYNGKITCRETIIDNELRKKISIILSLLEREFIPLPFFVFSKNNLNETRRYLLKIFNTNSQHVILVEDLNEKHIENLLQIFYECSKRR